MRERNHNRERVSSDGGRKGGRSDRESSSDGEGEDDGEDAEANDTRDAGSSCSFVSGSRVAKYFSRLYKSVKSLGVYCRLKSRAWICSLFSQTPHASARGGCIVRLTLCVRGKSNNNNHNKATAAAVAKQHHRRSRLSAVH